MKPGDKWYEVMSGDPPADLEKKIESKEWAGTLPAARDEWGDWSKKLEVCLILRIPSKENMDPQRLVPGRENVYIVAQGDCIPNAADNARYFSNKNIEKVLLLRPPESDYVSVLDDIAAEKINARVECTSARDEDGGMAQVQLSRIALDSRVRDEAMANPKTPWCDSIVKFTAHVRAKPDDPTQNYLERHRKLQETNAGKKHWPENVSRFKANEMKAALIAVDQAEMQSYTIVYHYCSADAACRMCETGCGLDAGLMVTTLSPSDLNWEKHAGGKFQNTAGEALWSADWRDENASDLQAVVILGVPSRIVAECTATSISKQMIIPESLLVSDGSSAGAESMVYSNAFVRKVYVLELELSSSTKPTGEPLPEAEGKSKEQVLAFFQEYGYDVDARWVDGAWDMLDRDQNGVLDELEFEAMLDSVKKRASRSTPKQHGETREQPTAVVAPAVRARATKVPVASAPVRSSTPPPKRSSTPPPRPFDELSQLPRP